MINYYLIIGYWYLFGAWDLGIGISMIIVFMMIIPLFILPSFS
jgi:hypothetical protein